MRKSLILYLVSILLLFSSFPSINFANDISEKKEENIILYSKKDEVIPILDVHTKEILFNIPNKSEATLIEKFDENYSIIRYIDFINGKISVEGLVLNSYILNIEEFEQLNKNNFVDENSVNEVSKEEEIETINTEKEALIKEETTDEKKTTIRQNNALTVFSISNIKSDLPNSKKTSLLGHFRGGTRYLYTDPTNPNVKPIVVSDDYKNKVYYIKREVTIGKDTFYLLSEEPSDKRGLVGWVKSTDLSTREHIPVDKDPKTFYIKGNGKATTKAWGGSRDTVHADMTKFKNQVFKVNLTERVGNNIWYRGKIQGEGPNVWLHSSYVHLPEESRTSKLGHIRGGKRSIYPELGSKPIDAESYKNAVYYIKRQAVFGSGKDAETYYLLSTEPSDTRGVIGWAKSTDLSTHDHVGVDKKEKLFLIKGNGKATSKAWGGSKDTIHANLSTQQGRILHVDLTEKVGNNIWYRGKINGEGPTVWLHSSYVSDVQVKSISRLGHIRGGTRTIYKDFVGQSFTAGEEHKNKVYYIKREITVNGKKYYLLSTNPSAVKGVVGWASPEDLSTHEHKTVDKKSKIFIIKGTGSAYTKAWGGSQDLVYANLKPFEGNLLYVNLTETVGKNTWYRGRINNEGQNIWIHESYLKESKNIIKIFIDPGHGGSDPGAVDKGTNTREKDLTLDIAKRIVKYLNQYSGIEIKMSRTDDRNLSLDARTKMANDWGADYYVSVHINAGGGTGFESYIYEQKDKNGRIIGSPTQDEIKKQAIIHDHIAKNIKSDGVRDRGKKRANFQVLRESNMSAILFEYLFIDNTNDRNKLLNGSFRDKLAKLTAEGIAKAFGLKKK